MTAIYCPNCKRFLFKAKVAEVEIKCPKCKQIVKVKFLDAKSALFGSLTESCEVITIK